MSKEPIFIYDPQKREWKTIYVEVKQNPKSYIRKKPQVFQQNSPRQYKSIQIKKSKPKMRSKS